MKPIVASILRTAAILAIGGALSLPAQAPVQRPPDGRPDVDEPPPGRPSGGPGGPGGPNRPEVKLVEKFDRDENKRLDTDERKAAREFVQKERAEGRLGRGPGGRRGPGGGPGGRGPRESQEPARPGPKISPADVKSFPGAPLYDPEVVRTFFLEFENADWEKELGDFNNTDVEVPATLTVDGKTYRDVGIHFRGASSYFTVGEGSKRSLNLSLDFAHKDQRLLGYRTLNLLNSHTDPTFLRTVLFYQVAREYIPAPKANYVRVVINGESWGVYVNAQQFNKDLIKDTFNTTDGARWKVPGSPRGQGSLAYLGDDPAEYRGIYEIKSRDDVKSWQRLIQLSKVLNQTPADKLEAALAPLLDIDGALKFLALENALINNDGYWVRTSDYNLYLDTKGKFHFLPHDTNETFARPGGPGGPGRRGRGPGAGGPPADGPAARPPTGGPGPQGEGVKLDPLIAAKDPEKPLISKLLAVPALRARYLAYVRDIAEKWLDWKKLGPIATSHQSLIASEIKADTRKLASFDSFQTGLSGDGPIQGRGISLKSFADQRRAYLLDYRPGSTDSKVR
jgi:hypothetical protein